MPLREGRDAQKYQNYAEDSAGAKFSNFNNVTAGHEMGPKPDMENSFYSTKCIVPTRGVRNEKSETGLTEMFTWTYIATPIGRFSDPSESLP